MPKRHELNPSAVSPLFGVPRLIGFESPASWLTRAALSQGVGFWDLLKLFNVDGFSDPDLYLSETTFTEIAKRCSLPVEDFGFSRHIFANLKRLDADGTIFLLSKKRAPMYRYCPVCLQQSRTKHFMVHWRFAVWRYCPLHDCMMDDTCRKCGSNVVLPTDMLNAGPEKKGLAYMDQCMKCGHRLSSHWRSAIATVSADRLTNWEWSQLLRGRAFLSAIYHGKVLYQQGGNGEHGLRDLLLMERKGMLPNKNFSLTATEAESRKMAMV